MKKVNKKELLIFTAIVLFISSQVLPKAIDNLDEIWNFNFARCIANGLVPYKDFNIIQGPLLPLICALFLKIFGQEMIVTRFLTVALDSVVIFMAYKIMNKIEVKDYFKYIVVLVLAIIMKPYFALDYNWASLLLTLIIIYIEISKENTWKKDLTLGLISGFTIALKQTTGLIIVLATIGWKVFTIRNLEDFKKYIKTMALRFLGAIVVILAFILILLKLGALNYYIDYCILGIKTFSNKISYIERLVKNSDILIRMLSIWAIFVYFILLHTYIKTKKDTALILLIYSIVQMVFVYPIADEAHFVIAVVPTLISIGYLLNLVAIKINVSKVEEIVADSFLRSAIMMGAIVYFIYGICSYQAQNINLELNHFKYLPIEEDGIVGIKEIEDFITSQEKSVYILDATAALYMIPIDRYNKNYDMFNKGNLGSKDEDGQIENLKVEENKIILIKNKKHERNWQNPEQVRKYVINNMNKIGEIGSFDIYE